MARALLGNIWLSLSRSSPLPYLSVEQIKQWGLQMEWSLVIPIIPTPLWNLLQAYTQKRAMRTALLLLPLVILLNVLQAYATKTKPMQNPMQKALARLFVVLLPLVLPTPLQAYALQRSVIRMGSTVMVRECHQK